MQQCLHVHLSLESQMIKAEHTFLWHHIVPQLNPTPMFEIMSNAVPCIQKYRFNFYPNLKNERKCKALSSRTPDHLKRKIRCSSQKHIRVVLHCVFDKSWSISSLYLRKATQGELQVSFTLHGSMPCGLFPTNYQALKLLGFGLFG